MTDIVWPEAGGVSVRSFDLSLALETLDVYYARERGDRPPEREMPTYEEVAKAVAANDREVFKHEQYPATVAKDPPIPARVAQLQDEFERIDEHIDVLYERLSTILSVPKDTGMAAAALSDEPFGDSYFAANLNELIIRARRIQVRLGELTHRLEV